MKFQEKKKKERSKKRRWEWLDLGIDLFELFYYFARFLIRSIAKFIN
ncbi:hypothetical protein [Niallia sp. 03133]